MTTISTDRPVLVTGGTGFVGMHIIFQLLQQGFTVRTTVRSLSKRDGVISALRAAGVMDMGRLSFVVADLGQDDHWEDAVRGCDYVLHVASPFPLERPADENELIIPARDGSLRVLRAARDGGVKRVVLTSSFAAVGYSIDPKDHVYTERDWTDPGVSKDPYIKSKAVAERAAWDFMVREGGAMELTVINPVGIFGPAMGKDRSASLVMIQQLLDGVLKESPAFSFGVVDVRDVAAVHITAMTHPAAAGERFIATADGVMTFYDVAQLIRRERPVYAERIAEMWPNDPAVYIALSNEKARRVLDWQPRSKEAAILASVDSIAE